MDSTEFDECHGEGQFFVGSDADDSAYFANYQRRENALSTKKVIIYERKPRGEVGGKRGRESDQPSVHAMGEYGLRIDYIRENRAELMRNLLASFNSQQLEDVKSIGFGGLVLYNCTSLPPEMNEWLIDCFNPFSRNFTVRGKIKFTVTGNDARRAFGLNHSKGNPVLYSRTDKEVVSIISDWKTRFYVGDVAMDLYHAASIMSGLINGGVDFKRLFVLFVMKAFLTPEFGAHLEMGLLRSLVDVGAIRHLDWGGYILDHLCDSIKVFQQHHPIRGCEGCLLLLQLLYFHSCIWKGLAPLVEEPWIKHWYSTKLGDRVMEEMLSGGFGEVLFIKKQQRCLDVYNFNQVDNASTSLASSSIVPVGCPVGMWRQDDISSAIEDDGSSSQWLLLRDVELAIGRHVYGEVKTELRDTCLKPVPRNRLAFDAKSGFERIVHELHSACRQLNPNQSVRQNLPFEETMGLADPFGDGAETDAVQYGNPWKKWVYSYPAVYLSRTLQKCATYSHCFPPYRLELADFCLSSSDQLDFCETLFSLGGLTGPDRCCIIRGDLVTMDDGAQNLDDEVLTAFAGVLSYEWVCRHMKSRVCLFVIDLEKNKLQESVLVKDWKDWIQACHLDLLSADFVMLPVLWRETYYCLIVNFRCAEVQCIVPANKGEMQTWSPTLTNKIVMAFSRLLSVIHHNLAEEVSNYRFVILTPKWSNRVSRADSGVCVMNIMERYSGFTWDLDHLRLSEEENIIQLRVAYTCFMVLSLCNIHRKEVLIKTEEHLRKKWIQAQNDG